jgi:hypothetical protein
MNMCDEVGTRDDGNRGTLVCWQNGVKFDGMAYRTKRGTTCRVAI